MHRQIRLPGGLLLLVSLLMTACAGAAVQAPAPTPTVDIGPVPDGFPDHPAGVTAPFRSDPPTYVAGTGRPQVIEFYASW